MEPPKGWVWSTLASVASWGSGGTPKSGVAQYYGGDIPWVVSGDLNDEQIHSVKLTITAEGLKSSSAKWVPEGSVLIAMYGATIGKLAITGQPLTTNQAVAFATPHQGLIDKRFLFWYLRSQRDALRKTGKGGAQPNISQAILKAWPVPVPPVAEQHRIVEALEDHISRLDVAGRELDTARQKIASFRKSILLSLVPESIPESWEMSTVGEAGTIGLGRQRHPDWHHGPEMRPYLRVANVFEDRIDTSDVMEMDFSGVFERFRLEPGDILLNEGQSPHLVGRPALYRGTPPNVAFTNSLLRFQARPDVLPEWALMVFRRHLHARRFMREVRITTNIAHLSVKRLKPIEFPIPPLEEQKRRVQACEELMSYADAMEHALKRNLVRAKHLRSAVLERAFTGRLVAQDSADESASDLLDRIRAEREVKPKRASRRPRKSANADAPPAPPASSTLSATTAVQQELPL
ncbi:restriction endonuclease subunit S [Streptomyces coriariae]|uniref:restriction endonuclease subunit S n=1 Tax=Streptomyces coriariae TaxID=2864460 RepID=UPI001E2BA483|nr:restriction endonuclease subunit S [Streptomyces coriariae]